MLFIVFKAPDKRSVEPPPNIPKRGPKKSSIGDSLTVLTDSCQELSPDSLRDSGISISDHTNLNNLNHAYYEDFDLKNHQQEMNISNNGHDDSPKEENPPPIPPKTSLNTSSIETGSLDRKKNNNVGLTPEESD